MWLLSPFHPIRRIAIRVLAHPIFSLIVILTILANCYVMILPDSEYTNATEIVFTAIYTYESSVKVSKFKDDSDQLRFRKSTSHYCKNICQRLNFGLSLPGYGQSVKAKHC
jgi:hypothetical protein